jgi:eukaryotic-like serine/threonine-protein kinase
MTGADTLLTVGRYGIDEWLASDAAALMFRGHDPLIERPVAIKIVRRELTKGSIAAGWRERFKRKARAGGRLFHPNIATILDYGEEDEMPFVVMEYVDGQSLDRVLKTSGPLPPGRAVAIFCQVLNALGFSHENGVFHLGIRPANVFVQADDKVKVADFGIAKIDASDFTAVADILGTPAYMAPEQSAEGPVDHRADLFSAGFVLFEMLTGTKPFPGQNIAEITSQMQTGTPEDVRSLNPEVSDALRRVIDTALAYDPARRFATAGAFSRALADAVSGGEKIGTAAAASPNPAAAHWKGWDTAMLRIVEGDLATYIGPIAAIAVRRAAKGTANLADLYETLSSCIENGTEREEFKTKRERLERELADRATMSPPEKAADETRPHQNGPAELPDLVMLDTIEARLAQHIGPIARILLKQELQHFESVPALCRTLAENISDDAERAAFLNWAGAD